MENREELNPEFKPPASEPAVPPRDALHAGLPPTVPVPPIDDVPEDVDDGPSIRQWLAANAIALIVVACVLAFIFYRFRLEDVLSIAKAFLGLSFVVFIHEMGHFLVAKWCDVHVTTFSIGFGPAIPGCAFQWGETTYKFSLIPIGGYVQMVGQVDGDESADGSEDDPRSFRNKSVGQRMAIISAGVIMNVILAVICFIIVFRGPGKERPVGVVDQVDTSGPAFKYGIRTGAKILQIGNTHDPHFEDLMVTIMGSTRDEKIRFVSELPGEKPITLDIEPRLDKGDSKPMFGIAPPLQAVFRTQRGADPDMTGPVLPGSAVAETAEPFHFGDRVIATTDPDDPQRVTDLPEDPRFPGDGRRDYFEFTRRMKLLAGKPVVLRVEREVDDHVVTRDITVASMPGMTLGVRMQMGSISAIRLDSAASKAALIERDSAGNREGDRIEFVEVTEPNGKPMRFDEKNLDPERLPDQLKAWARRLAEAQRDRSRKLDWTVRMKVRRHRTEPGPQFDTVAVELAWDDRWRFDDDIPLSASSPMAIPELGLAYQIKTVVAAVLPGAGANGPLQVGDVIKNYRLTYLDFNGKETTGKWLSKDLEEGQWARTSNSLLRSPIKVSKVEMKVQRGKDVEEVTVTPGLDEAWPLDNRGWLFMRDMRRQRADSFVGAIRLGLHDTGNSMKQVFQNLRGMVTGRVSFENFGGPLLIANVAYRVAGYDFWEFLFFLGLISVNLAVVNFLPIPVLDGGHFVFLLYEKLRGRPASEPIRVVATYAGLALILSLFVFVTWLDFWRFW